MTGFERHLIVVSSPPKALFADTCVSNQCYHAGRRDAFQRLVVAVNCCDLGNHIADAQDVKLKAELLLCCLKYSAGCTLVVSLVD